MCRDVCQEGSEAIFYRREKQNKNAEGGTRTHMGLLPHAPETCVSTNFTTSALFPSIPTNSFPVN